MEKRFFCLFFISCTFLLLSTLFFMFNDLYYYVDLNIYSVSSLKFSLSMIFDPISVCFSGVVSLISFSVFMFAVKYMEGDIYSVRFFWILLLFVISMNMLIFSGSLLFLLIGWDGLGLSSFALIIYYSCYESFTAGYMTLMINRLGDVLIVSSCCLFIFMGSFSLMMFSNESMMVIFVLSLAALTKSAQYPFSSWLPAAMAAPTPVSALVHSSTLVTAGIYLIIRLSSSGLVLPSSMSFILMMLGSVTCLLGGVGACLENDLKKIIALSTLSQLGVMTFSLGVGYSNLALFHLFTHAMFKALLFISAGVILMMSFGCQDVRLLGGLLTTSPLVSFFFVLSGLCLAGAPFLSGFFTKHIILEVMVSSSVSLILSFVTMVIGSVSTVFYSVRLMKILFAGPPFQVVLSQPLKIFPGNVFLIFPMCLLGIFSIVSGKLFLMLNINFVEFSFNLYLYELLLNILLPLGFTLAMTICIKNKYFLNSMFFLWPLFMKSGSFLFSPIKVMGNLDLMWLEPKNILGGVLFKSGYWFNYYYYWPSFSNWGMMKAIFLTFFLILLGSSVNI